MNRSRSKFTPTNIQQITSLVELGKTTPEIAEIIGVTPGTLKVTCSRLGISLRRPRFARTPAQKIQSDEPGIGSQSHLNDTTDDGAHQQELLLVAPLTQSVPIVSTLTANQNLSKDPNLYGAALTLRYQGKQRLINLPLDRDLLGLLALEAEFRSTSVGNLIADMLRAIARGDMFASVLAQADA